MRMRSKRKRSSLFSSSFKKPLLHPPSPGGDEFSGCRELVLVPSPTTSLPLSAGGRTRFRLPKGWRVEEVPRVTSSHIDRYYYEPGTRRKFRSLLEVQRHISGEEYTPEPRVVVSRKSSRYRKIIIANGKMLRWNEDVVDQNQLAILASSTKAKASHYNLPDGWVVEEVPRRRENYTDKYFYEPGTGRKFRSHIAVQRYLAEVNDDDDGDDGDDGDDDDDDDDDEKPLPIALEVVEDDDTPLAKMFNNSALSKKEVSRESKQNASFLSPPKRIDWVISSPQGDAWNPFIGETLVPDSVKKQWCHRFILLMNDGKDTITKDLGLTGDGIKSTVS